MKKIAIIVVLIVVLAAFSACTTHQSASSVPTEAPVTKNTEAPTAAPTAEPTAQTTSEPTAKPAALPADEHDYTVLRDFFEQADEEGVKNGDKLFPNYDPNDISTWYDGSASYDNFVRFDDSGKASYISIAGTGEAPLQLAGKLTLSELGSLMMFTARNAVLEEVDATDLLAARIENGTKISVPMVHGEAQISSACTVDALYLRSATHVLCDITGDAEGRINLVSFRIDVKTEGEGYAGVSVVDSENGFIVTLVAEPMEGKTFVGWFDETGKLVSTDAAYELFGEQSGRMLDDTHQEYNIIAKFES